MRVLRLLVACLFLAAGAVLGVLNPQSVSIDLGPVSLQAGLGASLLGAMLVGIAACGLLLSAAVILPLQLRLQRLEGGRPAVAAGKSA